MDIDQREHQKKLLEQINTPQDLRALSLEQLPQVAEELRHDLLCILSKIGGHLGAGLGVVELTIALHYVFDTPNDLLVWDIGHQAYPHKYLTGRKHLMHTIRQGGGLSGFLKRSESEYDVLGAGHCSTSISAALGMAVGRDFANQQHDVIAVIGDGALSAGMAYEAMNNAGHLKNRMLVILNDNKMSIAPAVGAMSQYLNRLLHSKPLLSMRNVAKSFLKILPDAIEKVAHKAKKYAKDFTQGGNFFEEMGFHYIGPIDGHDLEQLVPILQNIKSAQSIDRPILLHIITEKGKGFHSKESCGESYHAVSKFDLETKVQYKTSSTKPTYTKVFAQQLTELAAMDEKIVAITAAMPSGTGLNIFAKQFADRMFDVGIAEQHAVTFAAGLAITGMKPYVAIYSTFLQRAYDQVVHDVAIQCLPVRFAIDRAGLVGADGPTHAGSFDLAFLANLPNFVVMAPSDEVELMKMVVTSHQINDRPSAFRFPRGEVVGIKVPSNIEPIAIGKGRIIQKGEYISILSLGTRLAEAQKAADYILEKYGIKITIADARFAKPLDTELIQKLAKEHEVLITIEEGAVGGFGAHVGQFLTDGHYLNNNLKLHTLCLPDCFIDHDSVEKMYEFAGLNATNIIGLLQELIDSKKKNAA